MTKEDLSITYENNIFYCTKNNTKWISVDGEKWYGDENRIAELEAQIEQMKNCKNCANYMISGKCPSLFRTGWCKNWEMAKRGKE